MKNTKITERVSLKYSFDVFNLTNTPSFDIPLDDVSQNQYYNNIPVEGTHSAADGLPEPNERVVLQLPFGLGVVNKTIGSPRQIQMSLSLQF